MKPIRIQPRCRLQGAVTLPGDKSISHRAVILASMARGRTVIKNFLFSDDCIVTLRALRSLGVKILAKRDKGEVIVVSQGILRPSPSPLYMGESGTSVRILLGLLAAQSFKTRFNGSLSLSKRPMARVIEPLRLMGAKIRAERRGGDEFLPFEISPAQLQAIQWKQKIPSAQVKSAILLAGFYAKGRTIVKEPVVSRDHTERMLKFFKSRIKVRGNTTSIERGKLYSPGCIFVPGDISSAAFFIVAALLTRESKILIKNVGINPTRMGAVRVLKRMGANIRILNKRKSGFEPLADIKVVSSKLHGTVIREDEIPSLVDELPVLMVAASLAKGRTFIEGAGELRVKETDRIKSMCSNLMKLGANIRVKSLKKKVLIEISGTNALKAGSFKSFHDHRTAMSMFVAACAAKGPSTLDDASCINKSFPEFLLKIRQLFV